MRDPFRKPSTPFVPDNISPVVLLWTYRILVPLNGQKILIEEQRIANPHLAVALGLGNWLEESAGSFNPHRARAELRERYEMAERAQSEAEVTDVLRQNVQRLAGLVRLNETERRILEFAVSLHGEAVLEDAGYCLGFLTNQQLFQVLSVILALPEAVIRSALSPSGLLAHSGLLKVDAGTTRLDGKLDLLSNKMAQWMQIPDMDPITLRRQAMRWGTRWATLPANSTTRRAKAG